MDSSSGSSSPFEERRRRFEQGPPEAFAQTLLYSIVEHTLPQLSAAAQAGLYDLLVLGLHAVAATVAEIIFMKARLPGFVFYLENFVDGAGEALRFSRIARELYDWPESFANDHFTRSGRRFRFDPSLEAGFRVQGEEIRLNPSAYFRQFQAGFLRSESHRTRLQVFDFAQLMSSERLETARQIYLTRRQAL